MPFLLFKGVGRECCHLVQCSSEAQAEDVGREGGVVEAEGGQAAWIRTICPGDTVQQSSWSFLASDTDSRHDSNSKYIEVVRGEAENNKNIHLYCQKSWMEQGQVSGCSL